MQLIMHRCQIAQLAKIAPQAAQRARGMFTDPSINDALPGPPAGRLRVVATHDLTGEGARPRDRSPKRSSTGDTAFQRVLSVRTARPPQPAREPRFRIAAIERDHRENMVLTVLETLALDTPTDGVAVLRLNRPDRLNAINQVDAGRARRRPSPTWRPTADVRAVVLTGSGRGFCSGLDIRNFGAGMPAADRPRHRPAALPGVDGRAARRRSAHCRNPSSPRSTGRASAPGSRCAWPPTSESVRPQQHSATPRSCSACPARRWA